MKDWERKFTVNIQGVAKEEKLSEKERLEAVKDSLPNKKGIFRLEEKKRKFIADKHGNIKVEDVKEEEK